MRIQSEIAAFAANVRAVASSASATVVDGFPNNVTSLVSVQLEADEMLRVLTIVRPRLLYLHEQWFDFEDEVRDISEGVSEEENDKVDISPLSALNIYRKIHDGELCLTYVAFVADFVLHLCLEEADWFMSFQSDASELTEKLNIVLSENRKNADIKSVLDIKKKAAELAANPAFNLNRAGREKRTYLAENLFPECDGIAIMRIVDEATNINWLNQQGG